MYAWKKKDTGMTHINFLKMLNKCFQFNLNINRKDKKFSTYKTRGLISIRNLERDARYFCLNDSIVFFVF